MNPIKVSVVIPVYNTEKYLKDAINSILRQTLHEIEIITINDGSTDNSLEMLKSLSVSDSRIKIISSEINLGLSVSRNRGMAAATGEYLYFFDSDDVLESDCLEKCYIKAEEFNLDFLIFDGRSFIEDGFKSVMTANYQRTNFLNKEVFTGIELFKELTKYKCYSTSVCLCFIRNSFIKNSGLAFYTGILYEDILFSISLYLSAHRVGSIKRAFFYRRIRANSIMTSAISVKSVHDRLFICSEIIRSKKQYDFTIKKLLNIQVQNTLIYLVKNLFRSHQIGLFLANCSRIIFLFFQSFKSRC